MVLLRSDKAAATPSPRATQSSFAPASASGTRQDAQQPIGLDGTIPARGMPTLKLAALHFDATRAHLQDGTWRSQQLMRQSRSPRLKSIEARPASTSEAVAALQGKSDADIVQMLLDNDLNTATFIEYVQQYQGSPTHLIPWLQTLAALATKVGLLLESTRFLTCDLQLARILMHIQVSARALVGGKRALAVLVNAKDDALLKVGDRGEVLPDGTESLSRGTSFAAHCARSGKPLLIGLPGSRRGESALQFNVDSGTGLRPETSLCVPCLDHLGNVLAVIQVVDRQHGGSFGRDDVVLLQRFAMQCGVSIRNAGGAAFSSGVATGQTLTPRATTHRTMASVTGPISAAASGSNAKPGRACGAGVVAAAESVKSRRPRTSDASVQCELIGASGAVAAD